MSNGSSSSSLSQGSDAPQAFVPRPDLDNHKIPIEYSDEKQVSGSDTEAFARNQPYGPSYYDKYFRNRPTFGPQFPVTRNSTRTARSRRRIYGLRPRWFWTVAVLTVLLLVGATAGAVVGGMMRRQGRAPSSASSTSPPPPPAELQGSHLSAVNWTDSSGAQRKAVFYQRNGTLHVSRSGGGGDGTAAEWAELDIGAQFPDGAGVAAMNATPLAASVVGGDADTDASFSAALYFMDPSNHVRDVVSTADDLATWAKGPLWDASVAASPMSGLAAAEHMCMGGSCLGDRIVVFQASGGDLYSVHGPDWSDPPTRIVAANIGTPLALTPAPFVNSSSGEVDWEAEQTQLRLYYHRDASVDEFFFNDETPLEWNAGEIHQELSPPPPTQGLPPSSSSSLTQLQYH